MEKESRLDKLILSWISQAEKGDARGAKEEFEEALKERPEITRVYYPFWIDNKTDRDGNDETGKKTAKTNGKTAYYLMITALIVALAGTFYFIGLDGVKNTQTQTTDRITQNSSGAYEGAYEYNRTSSLEGGGIAGALVRGNYSANPEITRTLEETIAYAGIFNLPAYAGVIIFVIILVIIIADAAKVYVEIKKRELADKRTNRVENLEKRP